MPFRRRRRVLRRRPAASRVRTRARPHPSRSLRRRRTRVPSISKFGSKWANPLPQTARFKLRYIDNGFDGSTTIGDGYRNLHVFAANNIYDPDYTGVGVQPYGFDELATLFPTGSVRVVGASITINFTIDESTATQVNCYVYPYRYGTAPTYGDVSDLRTLPYCRYSITDAVTGHTRKNWIKNYCSVARLFRDRTPRDQSFTSALNAGPSTGWFWHVVFDTSDVAQEVAIVYSVKICYYVVYTRTAGVNES